ncbi:MULTISPECIES: GIY-YIG nuclease family protein [unclassified Moorena]|uniref:GIY-YIG nuclease family protein n=1 Tax=unclassified Moorena TaxID=2683338 RepID=UPI0013FF63C7|nr:MULTISPECIES: GIY-YIG nuclease family protein [unclassified Moorena]NEO16046.1 GIY-YIG nuclease family protein [Moorena sp. SIO3E8]NEP98233.1 GIY-YIG nuclease family protein [Moorena sp. SIO3F7]
MNQQKIGYVYLIEELKPNQQPTGFYKIVITSRTPEERLPQLRTSSTCDLKVYSLISCWDSSALEKDIHRKFKDFKNFQSKRKGREWFDFRNYNIHEVVEEINSSVKDTAPPEPGYSKGNPIVGALLLLPLLGIVIINTQPSIIKDQRNYHAAQNVFNRKNLDAFEQYTQAQEKFQKFADSSSHECVKKYGEDMVAVISDSKTFLRSTGDHRQAWKRFEVLRKQVWPKQPVCNKIMDDIDNKNN